MLMLLFGNEAKLKLKWSIFWPSGPRYAVFCI